MFFQYKVSYYDPIDYCEKNKQGLVWGRNYPDAIEGVIEDYGAPDIDLTSIYLSMAGAEGDRTIDINEIAEVLGVTIGEREE